MAELERRKFTAEEGVRASLYPGRHYLQCLTRTILHYSTVTTTISNTNASSHIYFSLQRFHKIWPVLIVVQISCAIIPCSVPCGLDPLPAQEIYATLRPASGKLPRRCEKSETMSCKWILAQRRTLDGGRLFSICAG